jgi:hypothetical protein
VGIESTKEMKVAEPRSSAKSSNMKIQNNITFGQVNSPIDYNQRTASPGNNEGPSLSSYAQVKTGTSLPISITPMAGGTAYAGAWNSHIHNSYTLGVAMELSIISSLAIEAEVATGRYYIAYSNYGHNFTQYTYGGTAKVYLTRGVVQTYLGAGVLGLTYENMTYGPNSSSTYDQYIGAGQAIAGAELAVTSNLSIGIRGSYIAPLFNRPQAISNGANAAHGYEEASAMDTAMYRCLGTVKISL